MSITPEEVLEIARLARLDLTPEEVQRFQVELSKILEYVRQLEAVATDDADGEVRMRNALRPDVERSVGDPERLWREAPDFSGGFFHVPRVVE